MIVGVDYRFREADPIYNRKAIKHSTVAKVIDLHRGAMNFLDMNYASVDAPAFIR